MDNKKDENSPSNLWTRRSNSSKLSLSMSKPERSDSRDNHDSPSAKRFGSTTTSSHGGKNPFNSNGPLTPSAVASPTAAGASSAFGLGSGAFASFGSAGKPAKAPVGVAFSEVARAGSEKKDASSEDKERRPAPRKSLSAVRPPSSNAVPAAVAPSREQAEQWPLKNTWVVHYRPPTSKHHDYEKSMKPLCRIQTAQAFWSVYSHLKRPSALPTVSDYHFFKEGVRPVWEDEENKRGGKWTMRVKKGVADRFWEDLLLALVGDQFAEASEEVCGAVVSVRSGEDVFSVWTKNDGGRNVKIRETLKRVLSLPADTNLQWRSHDDTITSRNAADEARQQKQHGDKRRNTLTADKKAADELKE